MNDSPSAEYLKLTCLECNAADAGTIAKVVCGSEVKCPQCGKGLTAQIEYLSKGRKLDKEEIERLTAYIKQWAEDDAERDAQFQELERVLESLQNKWASRPIDHPNGEALARENESLRAALERYGYHESGCTAGFPVSDHCTCGFSAALAPESEVP